MRPPRDQAARLAELTPRHWKRLRELQSQKIQVPGRARRPVVLAPGSQSFPGQSAWAGATQQRARVRAMPAPGMLVGALRLQMQKLQPMESARAEA